MIQKLAATLADALQAIPPPTVEVKLRARLGLTTSRAPFHGSR